MKARPDTRHWPDASPASRIISSTLQQLLLRFDLKLEDPVLDSSPSEPAVLSKVKQLLDHGSSGGVRAQRNQPRPPWLHWEVDRLGPEGPREPCTLLSHEERDPLLLKAGLNPGKSGRVKRHLACLTAEESGSLDPPPGEVICGGVNNQ